MYKVFINDSSLELTAKTSKNNISYKDPDQLKSLVKQLEEAEGSRRLEVRGDDLEKMWQDFRSLFSIVEAAGGVVKNDKDEVLMIYRRDRWDLPKGKIDPGEKIKEAAVREVVEECGIPDPEITRHLKTTYHTYRIGGGAILKPTYWYEMKLDHSPALTPQKEEDITKAQWCDSAAVRENLKNTFGNIRELLREYQ